MQDIVGVASGSRVPGGGLGRCFTPSRLRVPPLRLLLLLLLHGGHLELLRGGGGDGRHGGGLLVGLLLLLLVEAGDVVVHEQGVGLDAFRVKTV